MSAGPGVLGSVDHPALDPMYAVQKLPRTGLLGDLLARGGDSDPFARAETLFGAILGQGARLPSQRRFAARSLANGIGVSAEGVERLKAIRSGISDYRGAATVLPDLPDADVLIAEKGSTTATGSARP